MMSLNIIGHCTNILEEMWFSSPPETSAEPNRYIYICKYVYIYMYMYTKVALYYKWGEF